MGGLPEIKCHMIELVLAIGPDIEDDLELEPVDKQETVSMANRRRLLNRIGKFASRNTNRK